MYNFTATMNIIYSKQEPKYEIISHKKILKKISLVFSSKKKKEKTPKPQNRQQNKTNSAPQHQQKNPKPHKICHL